MKVRTFENSIRLRLKVDEVRRLCELQTVAAALHFCEGSDHSKLIFTLTASLNAGAAVRFSNATVAMAIPSADIAGWLANQTVGFTYSVGSVHPLELIVEKDFPCLADIPQRKPSEDADSFARISPGAVD